jgi:hypothetical protein
MKIINFKGGHQIDWKKTPIKKPNITGRYDILYIPK